MKWCYFLMILASPVLQAEEKPSSQRQIIQVDPQKRANDYVEAFDILRKEKTSHKIVIHLNDGTVITNVIEMAVVGSGTLIHFKTNTPQGIKMQMVEVEKIRSINHL